MQALYGSRPVFLDICPDLPLHIVQLLEVTGEYIPQEETGGDVITSFFWIGRPYAIWHEKLSMDRKSFLNT